MSTNTLTSLAILKVTVDQGNDYLDYLRPFVLHVLSDSNSTTFTPAMVRMRIQNDFGLDVPTRTVAIVLRRLSRRHPIRRDHGAYQKTGSLPDTGLPARRAHAERHIESIVHALRTFADGTASPLLTDDAAVAAICAFLAEFDITCLRAYLRHTAIPDLQGTHQSSIVLVSNFVDHIQKGTSNNCRVAGTEACVTPRGLAGQRRGTDRFEYRPRTLCRKTCNGRLRRLRFLLSGTGLGAGAQRGGPIRQRVSTR